MLQLACTLAGSYKGTDDQSCILSSLANELQFNDLRDCQRRHKKSEVTKPANMATVAIRSGMTRSPLQSVVLDNKDWVGDSELRVLRTNVLQASREKDKEIGISLYGLIHDRNCPQLTKPHIFCQRLRFFQSLKSHFFEDRAEFKPEQLLQRSWASNVLLPSSLWMREAGNTASTVLVLCGGPQTVRYMNTKMHANGIFGFDSAMVITETLKFCMSSGKVSIAEPLVDEHHGMLFRAQKWMEPGLFLCEHSITKVTAGVLLQYGMSLGLQVAKLNHRNCAKKILEYHGYDPDAVESILTAIPIREYRKKDRV